MSVWNAAVGTPFSQTQARLMCLPWQALLPSRASSLGAAFYWHSCETRPFWQRQILLGGGSHTQHRCILCFKPLVWIKWSETLNFGLSYPRHHPHYHVFASAGSLERQITSSTQEVQFYTPLTTLQRTAVWWLQLKVLCAIWFGWVGLTWADGVSGKDLLKFIRLWNPTSFLIGNAKESTKSRIHMTCF